MPESADATPNATTEQQPSASASDGWGWSDDAAPPAPRPDPVPAPFTLPGRHRQGREPRPEGRAFAAEIDMTELDDRGRPTTTWSARTRRISRSNLVIASRRMCYEGRVVVVLVHLIDDEPVPLCGRVVSCHYEGDGLCLVDVDLQPVPEEGPVRQWVGRGSKR